MNFTLFLIFYFQLNFIFLGKLNSFFYLSEIIFYSMNPREALFKYFGFESFRQNQKEIIEAILEGKNVIAVLPTGAGKSLCYQIPALVSSNFSIVISPLIALMKDQVDALNKQENLASFINSTMSYYEAEEVLQNIAFGKTKILYVAPERLENIAFADKIKSLAPVYLFVDEAHCISEWGHNFRPSYRRIKDFIDYSGIEKIAAFTATATPEVVKDISNQLSLKEPKIFVRGFERENLSININLTKNKKEKCLQLISQYKTPAIIYTASRRKSEEISEYLNLHKIRTEFYHAGLPPEERKRVQEAFINDELPVIAATNAFGMGIDKKDIRVVIHYNTPGSIENFYQEIGRAGRDGKPSYVFLLHEDNDINIQNYFLSASHPDKILIQNIYAAICDFGKIAEGNLPDSEIPINSEYISAYCKKNITKGLLFAALKILENGGYLKSLSDYDKRTTVQINFDKVKLKEFTKKTTNENLKEVILFLLREYGSEIFKSKIIISSSKISGLIKLNESKVEESLEILENLGIISYNRISSKDSVILTSPRVPAERLQLDYKKINENYLRLQKKIDLIVEFVYSNECRFKYILNYFGEEVSNYKCGKCDNCVTEEKISESSGEYIKEIILRTIYESESLIESALLNILTGTSKIEKNKKISTFGNCGNYEFSDLKVMVHELLAQNLIERSSDGRRRLSITVKGIESLKIAGLIEEVIEEKEIEDLNFEENLELYNLLREARASASKRFLQTPYLICPDNVMRNVALIRPKNGTELLAVEGFNNRMYNKLGSDFLEILTKFNDDKEKQPEKKTEEKTLPQNIKETLLLLNKGHKLKDIASLRQLSEAVISMQIETILEYHPEVKIDKLYENDILDLILTEIKKGFDDLKDLKSRLPEKINYSLIRIAVAKNKFTLNYPS